MLKPFMMATAVVALVAASPAMAQMPANPAPAQRGASDGPVPTIPESQIAPAPLSSPFEFVSVATSADDFIIKAAALAETKAVSPELKQMAAKLASDHEQLMQKSQDAAKSDGVDIAKPGVDGEQFALLGKLELESGEAFDRLLVESLVFVHQRSIAYYLGYRDVEDALGAYARETLPMLEAHFTELRQVATAMGIDGTVQSPAAPR